MVPEGRVDRTCLLRFCPFRSHVPRLLPQLINSHSDVCFTAEYTPADVVKHEVDQFKAQVK
jgi:hypothetical protein